MFDDPVKRDGARPGHWIGVASRDHVRRGVAGGFCQLGHGKHAPVQRLAPGDRLVYYSPRTALDGGEPVQAFTAIGRIDAYQAEMDYPGRLKVTLMIGSIILIYLSAVATVLGLIGKIIAA